MLIGEISKKTGLSRDTIRFYERKKLINVARTDSEWNNYKDYTEETLDKLILIKKAKSFGFTLKEVAGLLELYDLNGATCDILSTKAEAKIHSIDEKINDLKEMKKKIIERVESAKELCSNNLRYNCKTI